MKNRTAAPNLFQVSKNCRPVTSGCGPHAAEMQDVEWGAAGLLKNPQVEGLGKARVLVAGEQARANPLAGVKDAVGAEVKVAASERWT
jgi:hypothetical protein